MSSEEKRSRKRKRKAIIKMEQKNHIEFGGIKTFQAWTKGREVYVEARADVARKIVEVSIDAATDVVMEETKTAVDGPKSSNTHTEFPDEDLEGSRVANPSSSKHIKFVQRLNRYEVHYQDEKGDKGVIKRCVKGLLAKEIDIKMGKRYSPDETGDQMARKHEAAKRLRNELDQSTRARYSDV